MVRAEEHGLVTTENRYLQIGQLNVRECCQLLGAELLEDESGEVDISAARRATKAKRAVELD